MPTMKWVRGLGAMFVPSKFSFVLVGLCLVWLILSGGCTAAVFSGTSEIGTFTGILVIPLGALLSFVAAIVAGRASSRSLLFGITTVLLGFGALVIPLSSLSLEIDAGAVFVSILTYSIPLIVAGGLAAFFGMRGLKELSERMDEIRADHLCDVLLARGEASFEALSKASGVPETRVDDIVDGRVAEGKLAAVLDTSAHMAFTLARFQAKEQELVGAVYARGRGAIYDIAKELKLSEERFKELLYASIAHGRFEGYVDWKRGIVFSADGSKLRDGKQCPSCGGGMSLAGRGVVACTYCGAEVLLK